IGAAQGTDVDAGQDKADKGSAAERVDFGRASEARMDERTAGNMLRVDIDTTHPLAFGVPQRDGWIFKETDVVLPPGNDAFSTVVRIADDPQVNGYLPDTLRKRFAGQPWATVNSLGKGTVVAFADDPAHRKYWHATERMLLNALFFSRQLRAPGARG